jgi:undecaprenyl-phosphate alpha-N-acetylglucosaminyl 1-phosphatetransferase
MSLSPFLSTLALATVAISLTFSFILNPLAARLGLVDRPGGRKTHTGDIPLLGGVVIFITFTSVSAYLSALNAPLITAMALLLVLGLYDDRYDLKPTFKLLGQVGAALIIMFAGDIHIASLGSLSGGRELLLGIWGYPLTLVAIVGLINALNMSDGIDGLAASLTLLALAHLVMAMQLIGRPLGGDVLMEVIVFGAAIMGFFLLNIGLIKNQKVFLGDTGSMILGLFLAYHLIMASQRQPLTDTLPTSLVPWMVALPVVDTLTLIYRRLRQGLSPMAPDRTHLHHLLMDTGLSARATLIVMLIMADVLFWSGFALSQFGGLVAGFIFVAVPFFYYWFVSKKLSSTHQ